MNYKDLDQLITDEDLTPGFRTGTCVARQMRLYSAAGAPPCRKTDDSRPRSPEWTLRLAGRNFDDSGKNGFRFWGQQHTTKTWDWGLVFCNDLQFCHPRPRGIDNRTLHGKGFRQFRRYCEDFRTDGGLFFCFDAAIRHGHFSAFGWLCRGFEFRIWTTSDCALIKQDIKDIAVKSSKKLRVKSTFDLWRFSTRVKRDPHSLIWQCQLPGVARPREYGIWESQEFLCGDTGKSTGRYTILPGKISGCGWTGAGGA